MVHTTSLSRATFTDFIYNGWLRWWKAVCKDHCGYQNVVVQVKFVSVVDLSKLSKPRFHLFYSELPTYHPKSETLLKLHTFATYLLEHHTFQTLHFITEIPHLNFAFYYQYIEHSSQPICLLNTCLPDLLTLDLFNLTWSPDPCLFDLLCAICLREILSGDGFATMDSKTTS